MSVSGALHLVRTGGSARLCDARRAYPPARLQSILAHCHAAEPWRDLAPGAVVPDHVADAAEAGVPPVAD